jgi:anti-anti-sigma regulatory factor
MLRITAFPERPDRTVLKVEGRVVADWVGVLESECLERVRGGQTVILDMGEVAFVDTRGAAMLRSLEARRVRRVNVPEPVEAFLRCEGQP